MLSAGVGIFFIGQINAQEKPLLLPLQDNAALRVTAQRKMAAGGPLEFGVSIPVQLNLHNSGTWSRETGGEQIWRQRVISEGALSLNFHFSRFRLPKGAFLAIFAKDRGSSIGPFYSKSDTGALWTPIIESEEVFLELHLPPGADTADVQLELQSVQHDFTGLGRIIAGSCNVDAVCSALDGWPQIEAYREGIRSVALYTVGGTSACTGFLVNNTFNDCTPYFLTALHCQLNSSNAVSMVVYWNYQNSFCRRPGGINNDLPGDGSLSVFNTGATFRASFAATDMVMVELNTPVQEEADAWFSGWDINPSLPPGRVACVHHAGSEEKRISWSDRGVYRGEWVQGSRQVTNGRYIVVPFWDFGTTESGSSGGPLFNNRGLAMGQLRGGLAKCDNKEYDSFGWLGTSWNGGGTPPTRLKDWLNPGQQEVVEWPGKSANTCGPILSFTQRQFTACAGTSIITTLFINKYFSDSVSLSIQGLPPGTTAKFSPSKVAPGSWSTLQLNLGSNVPEGQFNLQVTALNQAETVSSDLLLKPSRAPVAPVIPSTLADTNFLTGRARLYWELPPGNLQRLRLDVATNSNFFNPEFSIVLPVQKRFELPRLPSGQFFWRITAENDCGISEPVTGRFALRIAPLPTLNELLVSIDPNPGFGIFDIRFSRPVRDTKGEVYSPNGQLLIPIVLPAGSIHYALDLSGYPAGIYLLRLWDGEENKVFRLIKLR